jgi:hypothetical protein
MRERCRLSAMALGMLLYSIIPAATYAQDRSKRVQEQPQVVVDHSVELVTAGSAHCQRSRPVPRVSPPAGSGAEHRQSRRIYVLRVMSRPLGKAGGHQACGPRRAERPHRNLVTLTELPPDVISPSLIAETLEGTCLDLKSSPVSLH